MRCRAPVPDTGGCKGANRKTQNSNSCRSARAALPNTKGTKARLVTHYSSGAAAGFARGQRAAEMHKFALRRTDARADYNCVVRARTKRARNRKAEGLDRMARVKNTGRQANRTLGAEPNVLQVFYRW